MRNLICGIIFFIVGLYLLNNTLYLFLCIFSFWLCGTNIGFFIDNMIYKKLCGGTRTKDF